jgi:lysophospholipid acyltransferase (LPLAT)-like uncharacterized protein
MPGAISPAGSSPLARTVGALAAAALRGLATSWRVERLGVERLDAALAGGGPVLIAFWHGSYLPLFPLLQGRRACVITNRSFRGSVLREVAARFGLPAVALGVEGRGDPRRDLREALSSRQALGVAVDGPLGPARQVKPLLLELAAELGFQIVPVSVRSSPRHVARWRWDRRETPCPFARVRLAVGEPIALAPAARASIQAAATTLARCLDALQDGAGIGLAPERHGCPTEQPTASRSRSSSTSTR